MLSISACPCCGAQEALAYPALESAFVAERALQRPPRPTRLLECRACGLRYFEGRYEAAEAARLYLGYRGPAYPAAG